MRERVKVDNRKGSDAGEPKIESASEVPDERWGGTGHFEEQVEEIWNVDEDGWEWDDQWS